MKTTRNAFGLNNITSLKNIFYAYEILCRCVISLGMEPRRNMKRATVFVYHFAFLWEQHDCLLVRFQGSELWSYTKTATTKRDQNSCITFTDVCFYAADWFQYFVWITQNYIEVYFLINNIKKYYSCLYVVILCIKF